MSEDFLSMSEAARTALLKLSDEDLGALKFTMPWQQNETEIEAKRDPDGYEIKGKPGSREYLQQACWEKFNQNPQISTAIQGIVGRLTGLGFEISCELSRIQDVIDEIELDQRNRLYMMWSKYAGRAYVEGELYLCLTLHDDGFIEVDFIDPSDIAGGGEDGIIYHPTKAAMPLFYFVKIGDSSVLIPSIFIARYPELARLAQRNTAFQDGLLTDSRSNKSRYKKVGGFKRFIVSWDRSFMTKRNVSHLRTILEWLNHYENLKKYEIDHKKSAGSYLWVITMNDPKTFRMWLSMTEEERKKTGIMAKKTPGGTLIMPPGMTIECKNPSLPSISESDTDIFHMVTAGLNEPEDITSGQSKGTYGSVKASRGPMSDRISDQISYFSKFLRHDFYGAIFFLKTMTSGFPAVFEQKEAVDFREQEAVFKTVKKRPELLIDISFPTSETNDAEATARAFLGVKHGSVYDTLGIPNEFIAAKMGISNYRKMRLKHASEAKRYPELAPAIDQAAIPGQKKDDPKNNGGDKKGDQVNPDKKTIIKRRKKQEEGK